MFNRRIVLGAAATAIFTLFAAAANAAAPTPFTPDAFAAAQKSGKPVLIHIAASWCPTCRAQKPILSALEATPPFATLIAFEVDFDAQKDVVRALKANSQSTIIVFKHGVEANRSVGDTDPASLKALLEQAL